MSSNIERVLTSKLTAKKKAKAIGSELLEGALKPSDLLEMSRGLADAELAIVIESLEGASRKQPELVDQHGADICRRQDGFRWPNFLLPNQ